MDYIVSDGEVVIVDEFTGRLMPGRRYSEGLHQALEAKEKIKVKSENQTLATITFQNYFRMYDKLAGMTGTADTEAEEFSKIYKLEVMVIPTNRPMIRQDNPDSVYRTQDEKYEAAVQEIKALYAKGQPVLVGTVSVERSEMLAAKLKRLGVPHTVLNAKHHAKEAEIVAQAGRKGAVTISTNMAGRGTDIVLGGNPEAMAKKDADPNEDGEAYTQALRKYEALCAGEREEVLAAGGLHILGTERHESRRIDNQLRGRSGRQGDPGSSRFYLSLEDDLLRLFGSERIKGHHGQAGHGGRRAHRAQPNLQGHRERPAQGGGAQLRDPQAAFGVRRRAQQAARGDLRPTAQRHDRRRGARLGAGDDGRAGRAGGGRLRRRPHPLRRMGRQGSQGRGGQQLRLRPRPGRHERARAPRASSSW